MTPQELQQHVETIVVVMMENRSFDHVLGYLTSPTYGNRRDVDGIADPQDLRFLNPNSDGQGIAPFWTDDGPLTSDFPHDPSSIATQLAYTDIKKTFLMNGFVTAFENAFHTSVHQPPVMGLLRPSSLPTTAALAAKYTVCDRWFACLPTSTAPNRLMSMCGYSDIRDTGTIVPNQATVYEWLLDRGISWRVYYAGLPFFTLMPKVAPLILTSHFRPLSDLSKDLAEGDHTDWPQVMFIEPDYADSPIHGRGPCDNHPPLAMAPGERFLAEVYQTLSSDRECWARTVLIVTYDEHGGCFDHVPPLPVKYRNPNGVAFETTGPRVPTLVVGPFAPAGVSHVNLDNTSILQLIAERFGRPGEMYSPEVAGRRTQHIGSVSAVLSLSAKNSKPRRLAGLRSTARDKAVATPIAPSPLRHAFERAATDLAARHKVEAFTKFPELRGYIESQTPSRRIMNTMEVPPPAPASKKLPRKKTSKKARRTVQPRRTPRRKPSR